MNSSFSSVGRNKNKARRNLQNSETVKNRQKFEEKDELLPIEELRLNSHELEDYDFIYGNMKTTNILSLPLLCSKDKTRKRERKSLEERILPNWEDSIEDQPMSSTLIGQNCPQLELQLSPIFDEYSSHSINDGSLKNLRNSSGTNATSSEWYTIEQWKINASSLNDELLNIKPEVIKLVHSENHKVNEESYDEQNKCKRILNSVAVPDIKDKCINQTINDEANLYDGRKVCNTDGWKEMEESAFVQKNEVEKIDFSFLESKGRNLEQMVPTTLESKTNQSMHESGNHNIVKVNGEEMPTKLTEEPLEDVIERIDIQCKLNYSEKQFADVYDQIDNVSSYKRSEEIIKDDVLSSKSTQVTEESSDDDLKEVKIQSESSCGQIKNDEESTEYGVDDIKALNEQHSYKKHLSSFDDGQQNMSDHKIVIKENATRNMSTQEICFLENLLPNLSSSFPKIEVPNTRQSWDSLLEGVEPDFL